MKGDPSDRRVRFGVLNAVWVVWCERALWRSQVVPSAAGERAGFLLPRRSEKPMLEIPLRERGLEIHQLLRNPHNLLTLTARGFVVAR